MLLRDERPASPAVRFARIARVAIVGLLAPSILRAFASAAHTPLRGWSGDVLWGIPPLAFAAAGAWAAGAFGGCRRLRLVFAAGFGAAGLLVAPAYNSLQGLTGREPIPTVVGIVVAAYAVGFAISAATGALALGVVPKILSRVLSRGLIAGALGGLITVLPFLATVAGLSRVPSLILLLTVVAAFGGIIVPFRLVGAALASAGEAGDDGRL